MKKFAGYFLAALFLVSCSGSVKEKQSLVIDEKSIDAYVAEKMDTSQVYEILQGMRFSKGENYAYTAMRFSQQDSAILYTEEIEEESGITYRNIFFKEGLPVYVEEYKMIADINTATYRQRKVYLNGAIILKAYERSTHVEEELEQAQYKEITLTMSEFDFEKPEMAVTQQGDFEMKFGEFLVFDLISYLVLENEESGYNVAIYILKGDAFLDLLYADEAGNQGKTVIPTFEFMEIGGMQQMVYTGAQFGK